MKKIIIGSAFGHGAKIYTTAFGPKYLRDTFKILNYLNHEFSWDYMVDIGEISERCDAATGRNYEAVLLHNTKLCEQVQEVITSSAHSLPIIIGGDHSCGIGTWSGLTSALNMEDKFGLIWMDAHMDAHTLQSSPSKSYHGMPLSILLGKGDSQLSQIGSARRKINPNNLVLIGIRSFEDGEKRLLEEENVRFFDMKEIKQHGMKNILKEAIKIANTNTQGFGISICLDSFDSSEAPGVGSPEPNGLFLAEVKPLLKETFSHSQLKALEIAEFNPYLDKNNKTAHIVLEILQQIIADKT